MNQQNHLGQFSNEKIPTLTVVNDRTIRTTVNLVSTHSNVNNVTYLVCLRFL